jgi:2-methylcitrate dehydratase PrpD
MNALPKKGAPVQIERFGQDMSGRPYSRLLAEFVSEYDAASIPPVVLERARQSTLNAVAAALSAAQAEAVDRFVNLSLKYAGQGRSPLFGRTETAPIIEAALVNGFMAHYNDYDDTHLETVFHTNSPVVPPALLLAAEKHLSGRELLTALSVGLEASMRLGQALGPDHYEIGWHITGTMGTVGAALVCSRLLRHDARTTNFSLGFALDQASGLRGLMFGTAAKGLNAATGAMNGLLSALLADEGLNASECAIEGDHGYMAVASPKPEYERILEGLGERWVVPDIAFKPYASGVATHAAIDAAFELRRQLGLTDNSSEADVAAAIKRIASLDLRLPERYTRLPRQRDIGAGLEAKFSSYNAVSVAFVKGRAGPRDFPDDITSDANLKAFRELLNLVGEDRPRDSAQMDVQLTDGTSLTCVTEHAIGSVARAMSDADLRSKLFDAGRAVLDERALREFADQCQHLDQVADVAELVRLVVPPRG